ncbi:predicted protein [Aspergillus terreus NIH2624]|uniref:Uncharacterized protein n=1 Tax=Aspergillus terreus (strain NIH 2624 / FGSC A1156) TaxID=341663 RepID=Q0CAJ6_ASPTN|nr:uncharacterized protein ATEG_09288 [Aspergillus terreus NIH2624]EAU30425.1 predicted protein [Aspergillus terreus NIH2624]
MPLKKQFPTTLTHVLKTHNGPVNAVTFSSYPGTYVLSGAADRAVHLSRAITNNSGSSPTETSTPIQKYEAHGYTVLDIAVAADNARFASVGGDRQVFLWDVEQGITAFETDESAVGAGGPRRYRNSELRVRSVFAQGDAVVLSGSEADKESGYDDAAVFAWDVLSGEVVGCVSAGEGVRVVSCVAWNEKGGCWAGGCSDGIYPLPFTFCG